MKIANTVSGLFTGLRANRSVSPSFNNYQRIINLKSFSRIYMVSGVAVLFITTLFWSFLGAKLQLGNADQLVNTDLSSGLNTFHGANFPSSHSFLLKWPLFFLVHLLGNSSSALIAFTIATVLLTVACLVLVISKIDSRPLVFGTICLALSSVLLMVPAVPYTGAILPVNMAMLATRNLEYILYITSLFFLIRSTRIRSKGFWLAVACLSLLIASDKLFLVISGGGALLALIFYASIGVWPLVNRSVNWLKIVIISAIVATAMLALINLGHITHISTQSNAGPYSLSNPSEMVIGSVYAVMGIFTNFGANPAFDSTIIRNIPHQFISRIFSLSGLPYVVNAVILIFGLIIVISLLRLSRSKHELQTFDKSYILSLLLIWSTVSAVISFVITNHYYAVDARYLSIALFAVFIAIATYMQSRNWRVETIVGVGLVLVISIIEGTLNSAQMYSRNSDALSIQNSRNSTIAQVLSQHPVNVLVGDYWRVLPTKLVSGNMLNVMPLSGCSEARQVLSSTAWQPDLNHTRFAYLLTLEKGLTDYPSCTLQQAVTAFGKPNASVLITGSLRQPKELLLFYDKGIHKSTAVNNQTLKTPASVVPITLDQLTNVACNVPSVMNIVAHEDDDLLFINPDTAESIKAGNCVRTIYLTAGDAGQGEFYWLSREQGTENAYALMLGISNELWIHRIVELSDHEYVTVANLKGNAKVSLIFMHLNDGNLKGEGFLSTHNETLSKLFAGNIRIIHSADGQSFYSKDQLVSALSDLMNIYQPVQIRTQSEFISKLYPDHSDHIATGKFTKLAYTQYENTQYGNLITIPIKYYIGYPIHAMPANVSGQNLLSKEATFLEYARSDGAVCRNHQDCMANDTYRSYLTRQYTNAY